MASRVAGVTTIGATTGAEDRGTTGLSLTTSSGTTGAQWRESGYWQRPEHRQYRYYHDGRPIEAHRRRDVRRDERHYEKREHRQDVQAHRKDR